MEYMEKNSNPYEESEDAGFVCYPTYKLWLDDKQQISFRWNNRTVEYFNINGITTRDMESGRNGMIFTQIPNDGAVSPDFSHISDFHAITYSRAESADAREWAYDVASYFTLAYVAEAVALAVTYTVLVVRKFKETA